MIILKMMVTLQVIAMLVGLVIICVDVVRGFDLDNRWARIAGACVFGGLLMFLVELIWFALCVMWLSK
jgi:hypothetical protein